MSVIVFDANNPSYNGNLETANGAYKASGYNLGAFSTTRLALTSTRNIAWTPAQAGILQGIVLCLSGTAFSPTPSSNYSVTVQLEVRGF